MFEPWYTSLAKKLKKADEHGELKEGYASFCQIELGLFMLEQLGIENPNELWVLLARYDFPEYARFTPLQKRALANGRLYLNFGNDAWLAALSGYQGFPSRWRMFQIGQNQFGREPDMTRVPERQDSYSQALSNRPEIKRGKISYPDKSAPVHIIHPLTGKSILVNIDPKLVKIALEQSEQLNRLSTEVPPHQSSIQVSFADLREYAQKLDLRSRSITNSKTDNNREWIKVIDEVIRYRPIQSEMDQIVLGPVNQGNLEINGVTHVAGMVGAGKTSFAELLAMYGAEIKGWRITLIVGDTLTALDLANRINRVFDSSRAAPVAVPLIGRTTRGEHYKKLANSSETTQDHWGMTWLNPTCLIEGFAQLEELGEPFPQGEEPCSALLQKTKESQNNETKHTCPLFSICPSRELDRKIPIAKIWVTTPQALTLAWLAEPIDERHFRYAELVYFYSDLVIFDEIDADQQVIDDIYAPERELINERFGDLGEADRYSAGWFGRSPRDAVLERRRKALQFCGIAADHVSNLIEGYPFLRNWVDKVGYFSPLMLFHKLSLELDKVSTDRLNLSPNQNDITNGEQADINEDQVHVTKGEDNQRSLLSIDNPFMKVLWEFQSTIDKTQMPRTKIPEIQQLGDLMMYALYGAPNENGANQYAIDWIVGQLTAVDQNWQIQQISNEKLNELARKLELSISLSALEYNLHEISYGYKDQDEENGNAPDFQGLSYVPSEFLGAMPASPLGPVTGFRYSNIEMKNEVPHGVRLNRHLVYFRLASIGRYFLLHLSSLFSDSGYPGPAVLCMSGTSWMKDSDTHHFAIEPMGILEPTTQAKEAIRKSEFHYYPQRDSHGDAIRVSGSGHLEGALNKMAISLSSLPQVSQSLLSLTMNRLIELGDQDPNWADRTRILILVNSYIQAKAVAQRIENQIRVELPDWEIYYLDRARSVDGEQRNEDAWMNLTPRAKGLSRPALPTFGQHTPLPTVLIAPLKAVGRRHNILNQGGAAAFGAVFFATRPMKTPDDLSRWVYWINYQTIKLLQDSDNSAWKDCASARDRLLKLRHITNWWWSRIDSYKNATSMNDKRLQRSLAATMAATIIQASGRLLRRGVPFLAYFLDAAWAPQSAVSLPDTARTSLLVAMMDIIQEYCQSPVGEALFGPLNEAFQKMEGVIRHTDHFRTDSKEASGIEMDFYPEPDDGMDE